MNIDYLLSTVCFDDVNNAKKSNIEFVNMDNIIMIDSIKLQNYHW